MINSHPQCQNITLLLLPIAAAIVRPVVLRWKGKVSSGIVTKENEIPQSLARVSKPQRGKLERLQYRAS